MACGYPSFIFSYFFLILVLHTSLAGQNQFGRIFKENANFLFKEEIKQDTILKQKIVSEEPVSYTHLTLPTSDLV